MKKFIPMAVMSLFAFSAFADQITTNNTLQAQPVTQQTQTTQVTQQPQTNTETKTVKKHKPQKPKFNKNQMWCGDTHIKNKNADSIGDYCKNFDYKHDNVKFWDDRSQRNVSCRIKDNGKIDINSCQPIK